MVANNHTHIPPQRVHSKHQHPKLFIFRVHHGELIIDLSFGMMINHNEVKCHEEKANNRVFVSRHRQ